MSHLFLVERLAQCLRAHYGERFEDPWGVDFKLERIGQGTSEEPVFGVPRKRVDKSRRGGFPVANLYAPPVSDKAAKWHAGRVRYLISHPEQLADPIEVDCVCEGTTILPVPTIVDGWHRFFAHVWTEQRVINATFGGLVDVAEYLEGTRHVLPSELTV